MLFAWAGFVSPVRTFVFRANGSHLNTSERAQDERAWHRKCVFCRECVAAELFGWNIKKSVQRNEAAPAACIISATNTHANRNTLRQHTSDSALTPGCTKFVPLSKGHLVCVCRGVCEGKELSVQADWSRQREEMHQTQDNYASTEGDWSSEVRYCSSWTLKLLPVKISSFWCVIVLPPAFPSFLFYLLSPSVLFFFLIYF